MESVVRFLALGMKTRQSRILLTQLVKRAGIWSSTARIVWMLVLVGAVGRLSCSGGSSRPVQDKPLSSFQPQMHW
jgi:hypothetical protein